MVSLQWQMFSHVFTCFLRFSQGRMARYREKKGTSKTSETWNVWRMCDECVTNVWRMCDECVTNVWRMCDEWCDECVTNVWRMCDECDNVRQAPQLEHFLHDLRMLAARLGGPPNTKRHNVGDRKLQHYCENCENMWKLSTSTKSNSPRIPFRTRFGWTVGRVWHPTSLAAGPSWPNAVATSIAVSQCRYRVSPNMAQNKRQSTQLRSWVVLHNVAQNRLTYVREVGQYWWSSLRWRHPKKGGTVVTFSHCFFLGGLGGWGGCNSVLWSALSITISCYVVTSSVSNLQDVPDTL